MKGKLLPVVMSIVLTGIALNSHAQANQKLSNLTSPTAVNQSLLPKSNGVQDLGSSTKQWSSLYLSDSLFLSGLYLDGILTMYTFGPGPSNFYVGPNAG